MLKQTIRYEDFDENEVEETLYFNISRLSVVENAEELTRRWTEVDSMLRGNGNTDEKRELTISEVRMLVSVVKYMMELSYGVRSEDGRHFEQSTDLWNKFLQTATFDAFLFDLFQDTNKAIGFITGIFPKALREEASKVVVQNSQSELSSGTPAVEDNRPLWLKENRKPTPKELTDMTQQELAFAMDYQQKQKSRS